MFTVFSLRQKYNREVSYHEKQEFFKILESFSQTQDGKFLNEILYRGFKIYWCKKMTPSSGILGAFSPWLGKKIFLMPHKFIIPSNSESTWVPIIAPVLVHEMRHAWQFRKFKWLYILCCLPIVRLLTLELDADRITKKAERFCEQRNKIKAAADFAERMKQWS